MDARRIINQRRHSQRGRPTISSQSGRKNVSDLRQLINPRNQRPNIKSRLGFKRKDDSMKKATIARVADQIMSRGRITLNMELPRVVVKNENRPRLRRPPPNRDSRIQPARHQLQTEEPPRIPIAQPIQSAPMIAPSQSSTVLVTNLSPLVNQPDILELFGDVGTINALQMVNQNTALITYKSVLDAAKACQTYNGRLLDGLPMSCTILPPTTPALPSTSAPSSPLHIPSSTYTPSTSNDPRYTRGRSTAAQAFIETGLLSTRDYDGRDVMFTVNI